jgi:hypothetical protein
VAKDYMALAKQRIRTPRSQAEAGRQRMPRILLYSRNKKGKTRLASTAPNVLILDAEDGTKYETKLNPKVWPVPDWQEINDAYHYLKAGEHPYQWVTLDGLPKIYNSALIYVGRRQEEKDLSRIPGMVQVQDYNKANQLMSGLLWNFHALSDLGLIITSQERMLEVVELGDADDDSEAVSHRFVADVPDGCRSTVNSIVDIIGRMYIVRGEFEKKFRKPDGEIVTKKVNKQHRLWIGPHNLYDTGFRSEYDLPDFLPDPKISTILEAIGVK